MVVNCFEEGGADAKALERGEDYELGYSKFVSVFKDVALEAWLLAQVGRFLLMVNCGISN